MAMHQPAWVARILTAIGAVVALALLCAVIVPRVRLDADDSVIVDSDDASSIDQPVDGISAIPPTPLMLTIMPVVVGDSPRDHVTPLRTVLVNQTTASRAPPNPSFIPRAL